MADLTTVAAVKAFAGVTGAVDNAAISGIVSGVSVFLHGIIGHPFDAAPVTLELHAQTPSAFILLDRPAATVQIVRESGLALAATGWRAFANTRLVERRSGSNSVLWNGESSIDYTPISTVPADLELAAREAAAWVIKESGLASGASRLGLTAQANSDSGNADYYIRRLEELPMVRAVIRRYGRFV